MTLECLMKKKVTPFLLVLLGFIVLAYNGQAIVAGALMVIGITIILNWIWPEKWGEEENCS